MAIAIVATGGTIAAPSGSNGGRSADDLVDAVPELSSVVTIETQDFARLPSTDLTLDQMYRLAGTVRELNDDPDVEGVVVTHGTDTLEESAYFIDLCYGGGTPVVFTGAMRSPETAGADGPANLLASVRVAGTARARDRGVLVAMNDRVHAARGVHKTHSTAPDSFRSPEFGPLAVVDHGRVVWERACAVATPTYDPVLADLTNDVLALPVPVDASGRAIRAGRDSAAVCLGAPGAGNLPSAARDAIGAVRDAGVPVVVTTRCQRGRASRSDDLEGLGCFLSDRGLLQTRIKTVIALADDGLEAAFERVDQ